MLCTTMLASQLSLPFYTITPMTRTSEGCSQQILTLDAQTSLIVLPPLGWLNSTRALWMGCVLMGMGEKYCNAVHLLAHNKDDLVCYSYSQFILAHHCNCHSTFQLIPSIIIETLLGAALC